MNVWKSGAERRIEAATWGLLLIWAGVAMSIEDLPLGMPAIVAGAILLLSWFSQKAIGGEAGIIYWGGGLALTLSGLNDMLEPAKDLSALAVALIVIGVLVLVRAVAAPRGSQPGVRHIRRVHPPDDVT